MIFLLPVPNSNSRCEHIYLQEISESQNHQTQSGQITAELFSPWISSQSKLKYHLETNGSICGKCHHDISMLVLWGAGLLEHHRIIDRISRTERSRRIKKLWKITLGRTILIKYIFICRMFRIHQGTKCLIWSQNALSVVLLAWDGYHCLPNSKNQQYECRQC